MLSALGATHDDKRRSRAVFCWIFWEDQQLPTALTKLIGPHGLSSTGGRVGTSEAFFTELSSTALPTKIGDSHL